MHQYPNISRVVCGSIINCLESILRCYMGWTKDPEYNLMFVKIQQEYANEQLKRRGHLFLNEVYDMLDIPRTKSGAVMGWIYDEKHPYGSNFVDFSLGSERNRDFVNGRDNVALLDFNVDGNILDLI